MVELEALSNPQTSTKTTQIPSYAPVIVILLLMVLMVYMLQPSNLKMWLLVGAAIFIFGLVVLGLNYQDKISQWLSTMRGGIHHTFSAPPPSNHTNQTIPIIFAN